MQFLIRKQRNFFSAAVKKQFQYARRRQIIYMPTLRTQNHKFYKLLYLIIFEYIFNNNLYVRFLKQGVYVFHFMINIIYVIFEILLQCCNIIYDGVVQRPHLAIANDQSWKDSTETLRINTLMKYVECAYSSEF